MWIVKRKNRRSNKHTHPHFFRIGGEGVTAAGNGAVVMDLEVAAEVMEGAFADQVKMSHAEQPAAEPTLWSVYVRREATVSRAVPLIESTLGDLLGRRHLDRGAPDRRSAPGMIAAARAVRSLLAGAS